VSKSDAEEDRSLYAIRGGGREEKDEVRYEIYMQPTQGRARREWRQELLSGLAEDPGLSIGGDKAGTDVLESTNVCAGLGELVDGENSVGGGQGRRGQAGSSLE
jgi:hypothetical protein